MSQIRIDTESQKHIYFVTPDITAVAPIHNAGVQLTLKWRRAYQEDGRFAVGRMGRTVLLTLEPFQVKQAAEQERAEHSNGAGNCDGFCNGADDAGCYDYGRNPIAPESCLRCQLLDKCLDATGQDFRKVKGRSKARGGPSCGYGTAMITLLLIWVCTLCAWSNAVAKIEKLQAEVHSLEIKKQTKRQYKEVKYR